MKAILYVFLVTIFLAGNLATGQSTENDCQVEHGQVQMAPPLPERNPNDFLSPQASDFPEDPSLNDLTPHIQQLGLKGIVHAANHELKHYVVSYHVPGFFFKRWNLSMVSLEESIQQKFLSLKRNDTIWIQGRLDINSGQAHAFVEQLEMLKIFRPDIAAPFGQFKRTLDAVCVLKRDGHFTALVHAVQGDGKVLVLEHQDNMIPIIGDNEGVPWIENLYRGDLIRVHAKFEHFLEERPPHFVLNLEESRPIELLESPVLDHGQNMEFEGRLAVFPQSPLINRNIWAIQYEIPGVGSRYYTLVSDFSNDPNLEEFDRITSKLSDIWARNQHFSFLERNKLVNMNVKIKVTGHFNLVSQNQANAQIITTSQQIEAIELGL